jgi:hypothetical protein
MRRLVSLAIAILPLGWLRAAAQPPRRDLQLELRADPARETLRVDLEMEIDLGAWPDARKSGEYWFLFTRPDTIFQLIDKSTGKPIDYRFAPVSGTPATTGLQRIKLDLPSSRDRVVIAANYLYSKNTFTGFFLNPSTDDNLHFGQVRADAIFASHLRYYPSAIGATAGNYPLGAPKRSSAQVRLEVPVGWKGVTTGRLVGEKSSGGRTTFTYDIASSSGRLPYPFAIYPYQVLTERNVSIYFGERDRTYAVEKLRLINDRILPFLTRLMGPPPFEQLKVIEVFPFEGNTGLAARDVVMLSQPVWFAAPIGEDLTSTPAVVLVDEIAHQWNFYKVRLPNFLAEGVSEYTDALFVEEVKGREALDARIEGHRKAYARSVEILTRLRELQAQGVDLAMAAKRLEMTEAEVTAYWPYAEAGEVAISDAKIFPKLYFLKGAAALHALRHLLGDPIFFRGFRSVFAGSDADGGDVSLDQFRASFESASGRSLEEFFRVWYVRPGLPH